MPAAASAAESAVSDKAEWLKTKLAAMEEAPRQAARKASLSQIETRTSTQAARVKAFVPNRRLPRAKELDPQLISQQGRLDSARAVSLVAQTPVVAQPDYPLSGQVSAYSIQPAAPVTSTAAKAYPPGVGYQRAAGKLPVKPAQRSIPGQVVTLPGQIAPAAAKASPIPVIPEPPQLASSMPPTIPAPPRDVAVAAEANTGSLTSVAATVCPSPSLSADQQQMLDELVALNRPGKSPRFVDPYARGLPQSLPLSAPMSVQASQAAVADASMRRDPGPPPFPLNLLPPEALNELVGRNRHRARCDAPPQYFGSWHHPVAQAATNLPQAGFRSYSMSRMSTVSTYATYHHVSPPARTRTIKRKSAVVQPVKTAAEPQRTRIMMYEPYDTGSRHAMF